jgi:hypothetical protein
MASPQLLVNPKTNLQELCHEVTFRKLRKSAIIPGGDPKPRYWGDIEIGIGIRIGVGFVLVLVLVSGNPAHQVFLNLKCVSICLQIIKVKLNF